MKKRLYIVRYRLLAVLLPILFAVAPAMAQNVVYQGATTDLGVVLQPGETCIWELYNDSTVNFAKVPGACPTTDADFVGGNTGATVTVEWKKPGIYFYKVTVYTVTGCTNNLAVGKIKVLESLPTAVLALDPNEICISEPSVLSVTFTGNPLWSFVLEAVDADGVTVYTTYDNIDAGGNPFEITVSPDKTTIYRVTEVKDKYGENLDPSTAVTLTVHPQPKISPIYVK